MGESVDVSSARRLECLMMAVDFHRGALNAPEACVSTAKQFIDFVEGRFLEQ